ncbi:diguanylate cyclase [Nitrincola alkalilacustris]|uniref:diguanylate cyclase n=1 Tax=Nitrincola alkalilacustris TaxID=1571224 RepID=UPI00124C128C|nr:diguanylate cyclase [Nitrincola alkalilacustris]
MSKLTDGCFIALRCLLLSLLLLSQVMASELQQQGRWVDDEFMQPLNELPDGPAPHVSGRFTYLLNLTLTQPETLVIDFSHSSVLGQFRHLVYDAEGSLLFELEGGASSTTVDPYFLRHGRPLQLPAGEYQILSRLESPFYIATPTPMLFHEQEYREAINRANALVLIGLGIFIGLGFYYLVMGIWRRALTDLLYAGFIFGNLIYNASALLVLKGLFGPQWFYLSSVPILFSNLLYILFVLKLLEITRRHNPIIWHLGALAVITLICFWPIAWLRPEWTLELARYGVFIFGLYGLLAAIARLRQRSKVAGFYLIANIAFLVPALIAISSSDMAYSNIIWIEHIGLLAVLIEVLLLAQVMSYQVGLIHRERLDALAAVSTAQQLALQAQHDALTGLPGRALFNELLQHTLALSQRSKLPLALLYLDLDNLKPVNDQYGHDFGDALLVEVAQRLKQRIRAGDTVARIGGDEFVIILTEVDGIEEAQQISSELAALIANPITCNKQMITTSVSIGIALYPDHGQDAETLLRHADLAMYEAKQNGRNRYCLFSATDALETAPAPQRSIQPAD